MQKWEEEELHKDNVKGSGHKIIKGLKEAVAYAKSERDPNGIDAKTPGAKLDAGKAPIYRGLLDYFPRAIQAVAELSAYGANKYSWKGWEKVDYGYYRYKDAAGRHNVKIAIEGAWDKDAKNDPKFPADILHQTQVVWNELASLELLLRDMEGVKS